MKLVIATSILIAASLPALAATQTHMSRSATTQTNMRAAHQMNTQAFIDKAWSFNEYEIRAAAAAEDKATDAAFKDYARIAVTDHASMGEMLNFIVEATKTVRLPTKLDKTHEGWLKQLAARRGFEHKFRAQEIESHREALRLFRNYAANGANTDLKDWAKNAVATLEDHLRRAEAMTKTAPGMI
jgi:putative membrane protein